MEQQAESRDHAHDAQRTYEAYLRRKAALASVRRDANHAIDAEGLNGTLFRFQRTVVKWCLDLERAAVFADTGLGKSRMELSYAEAVAKATQRAVIIFTPLCTAQQLRAEAGRMALDVPVEVVRGMADVNKMGGGGGAKIAVANYEIAEKFDLQAFVGIVLDESSILKHRECKTGQWLIQHAATAQYRLCLTATPCPNDFAEIMNQAAFLGVATQDFLLNTFFAKVDSNKVKLRPHAMKPFAAWLSSWSVWVACPGDIGFPEEAERYRLPGLNMRTEVVPISDDNVVASTKAKDSGSDGDDNDDDGGAGADDKKKTSSTKKMNKKNKNKSALGGFQSRIAARRITLGERIKRCAELVNADDEAWVVWCTLNDESKELAKLIRGAVELTGTDAQAKKDQALLQFASGAKRVLVTKSEIAGFGLNWQHCRNMVFVSLTDSYERLYQAIRRCYRFGQERVVNVVLMTTSIERPVEENISRKEREVDYLKALMKQRMAGAWARPAVASSDLKGPGAAAVGSQDTGISDSEIWGSPVRVVNKGAARMINADCVVGMAKEVADASVDYVIFSPPFQALYRYSSEVQDVSNCASEAQFEEHMRFVAEQCFRALKPGRLLSYHIMNIPRRRLEHGELSAYSIIDLRGQITRIFEAAGFLLQSEVSVFRDPVLSLVQTKSQGLFYRSFCTDASIVRQALPDYVVTLRKPGANQVPITHDPAKYSMDDWIRLASPTWWISHTQTLNVKKILAQAPGLSKQTTAALADGIAKLDDATSSGDVDEAVDADPAKLAATAKLVEAGDELEAEDQKHPTPLQLPIIRNCVELWSNPGEVIMDPFSGIGSTGHVCKELGRQYVGIELAERYFDASLLHV